MRYLNWDVLLFPEDSKIPIQEFDVKCYALPVTADTPQPSKLLTLAGTNYQVSLSQIPTLTGFIPSLDSGRPFRVSVHSWEKPQPSELLKSLKTGQSRAVFDTRLYVDGMLKAQRYLHDNNSSWPEVIDCTTVRNHGSAPMPLRFPPFHPELLQQSHWGAGDDLGRIRIVIAEGIAPGDSYVEGHRYDRVRDVVVFSFQHAPRHILEYSGIAWPNPRMFQRGSISSMKQSSFEPHAHSPQRSTNSTMDTYGKPTVHKKPLMSTSLQSSKWAGKPSGTVEDPFIGHVQGSGRPRKTSTDVSMPDYMVSYHSSKNNSEMSGVSIAQSDFEQQVSRAAAEEILSNLSPSRRQALLDTLTPLKQPMATTTGTMKPLAKSNEESAMSAQPVLQSATLLNTRRPSTDSRRSVSGQSAAMSWEGTPMHMDSWSSNDYPGLLPSIQSTINDARSVSLGPKRKRSLTPPLLDTPTNDPLTVVKGMSTSPCKATPTSFIGKLADEDDATGGGVSLKS